MCLAGLSHGSPTFAQNLVFTSPTPHEFQSVIASLPKDYRSKILEAAHDVFPVFIFIPGIMGSKLTKTLPTGKSKLIWGEFHGIFSRPDADMAYADTDKVKAEILR